MLTGVEKSGEVGIEGKFHDGALKFVVPKAEETKPCRIGVNT